MKLFRNIAALPIALLIVVTAVQPAVSATLPSYYNEHLEAKAGLIRELQADECEGFYFWTDSHFPDNCGHTGSIIARLQAETSMRKVIFGGDLIKGEVTSLPEGTEPQEAEFKFIREHSSGLYPVRGNHDLTTSTHDVIRTTASQEETAAFFRKHAGPDAVFNDDISTDYYYTDVPKAGIRYIFFDTTDSVGKGRVIYGISPSQLRWIIENAILTTPKGWSLIFISHVPLSSDHTNIASIATAGECVGALSAHSVFSLDGKDYDFGTRPDLRVLLSQSGHRHSDVEAATGDVFNIITDCDSPRRFEGMGTPLSGFAPPREAGGIDEHAIDYASISKDRTLASFIRIGAGHNRYFHLVPETCATGDTLQLKSRFCGEIRWAAYDGCGNDTPRIGATRILKTVNNVAEITDGGRVRVKSPGTAIIVACNAGGDKEFYIIHSIH